MGRWYICQSCGEKFENPEFDLKCQKCSKTFVIKEAQVTDIPKFSLNLARKKEIRQNVASLDNIKKLLNELNFNIQIPGLIVGQKSGMTHHFSLIAKKHVNNQEVVIALDHSVSESEIQPSPLILFLYKTSEIKVDIPIFVAVPKLSETTHQIAQGHDILIVEGSTDAPEVLDRIKKEIGDRINLVVQSKPITLRPIEEPKERPTATAFFSKFLDQKKRTQPNKPI
jgi:DNA-directed RNA polymerase subunit RPC12/RpoP